MTYSEIQPWLFAIAPLPGESLSHFLGRFRRCNHLTPSSLGQIAKIGAVVTLGTLSINYFYRFYHDLTSVSHLFEMTIYCLPSHSPELQQP
jgi:hypothetical protein